MSKQSTEPFSVVKKNAVLGIIIALLLLLFILTVYAPNIIYFSQREFFAEYFIGLVQTPFLLGLLLVIGLTLVLSFMPVFILKYISAIGLSLSVLLWLQVDYFAVSYGVLDGAALDFEHYESRGLIELITLSSVLILSLILHKFILKHGIFICSLILIGLFGLVLFNVMQEPNDKLNDAELDQEFYQYSTSKNIIVIILDTFGAEYFQKIINKNPEMVKKYPGFVSYTDAISNYPATKGSLPSMLTGKMIPENTKFNKFKNEVLAVDGIPNKFSQDGYLTSVISSTNWLKEAFIERYMSEVPVSPKIMNRYHSTQLFDYALFRASIHQFKPMIFNDGKWLFSEQVSKSAQIPNTPAERGKMLLQNLVSGAQTKDSQPRFKLIHLTIPHPEYVYDRHCQNNEMIDEWPASRRMLEQSECALHQLNQLLNKYQELGIYDKSLIVVASDHGARVMDKPDITGFPSEFEMSSSGIMLMIKGIDNKTPFKQVDQPFSLIKLAPALLDANLHHTDYSQLSDDDRIFYAYKNWYVGARGYMQDAPIYRVSADYSDPNSWQLYDYGINHCEPESLPLNMTFKTTEREGYCASFGLTKPHANGEGTWTAGVDSRILFNLDLPALASEDTQTLQLDFSPVLFKGQDKLDLEVYINDQLIGVTTINNGADQSLEFEFSNGLLKEEKNVIKILTPKVKSMKEMGIGFNANKLGIFIKSIQIH